MAYIIQLTNFTRKNCSGLKCNSELWSSEQNKTMDNQVESGKYIWSQNEN